MNAIRRLAVTSTVPRALYPRRRPLADTQKIRRKSSRGCFGIAQARKKLRAASVPSWSGASLCENDRVECFSERFLDQSIRPSLVHTKRATLSLPNRQVSLQARAAARKRGVESRRAIFWMSSREGAAEADDFAGSKHLALRVSAAKFSSASRSIPFRGRRHPFSDIGFFVQTRVPPWVMAQEEEESGAESREPT